MGIHAWMIQSWPVCQWYMPDEQAQLPAFWHLNTRVREDLDEVGRRIGDTVWMAEIEGRDIAAAWEWTELAPGVVLLSDPNSLSSNLEFITEDRVPVEPMHAVVALNRITHSLPWQETVCAIIRTITAHPEAADNDRPRRHRHVSMKRMAQHTLSVAA